MFSNALRTCCSDVEFAAGIAKELQLEEEQLAVDKLTYISPALGCNDHCSCHIVCAKLEIHQSAQNSASWSWQLWCLKHTELH